VTIVTYQRDPLFGEIENEEMVLNGFGKIADECWRAIPEHFPNVELGAYVVMPNHVHGIIAIGADESTTDDRRGTIHLPRPQVLGIVPLRWNNFKNPWWDHCPPLSAHIRPPSRAASHANTTPPASGKEIITNI
jgi:hypothetical protein